MLAGRQRCVHLNSTISFHHGLSRACEGRTTTTTAARRGFYHRCAQTAVKILHKFPGSPIRHPQDAPGGRSGAQAGNQDDQWLDTIAVVLDGNVITAPQTASPIPGGIAQIAGNFTRAQAEELTADLQSGALPVNFRVSAISTAAPSASSQAAAG